MLPFFGGYSLLSVEKMVGSFVFLGFLVFYAGKLIQDHFILSLPGMVMPSCGSSAKDFFHLFTSFLFTFPACKWLQPLTSDFCQICISRPSFLCQHSPFSTHFSLAVLFSPWPTLPAHLLEGLSPPSYPQL